ncbi:MAG: SPFH domain-containing protein [Patescibacteria group bacterium]
MEEKKEEKGSGVVFWIITTLLFSGLFILEFFVLIKYSFAVGKLTWNWGWFAFWTQITYIVFSFGKVGPTETGVKLFFGKPIQKVNSGLFFAPKWIFSVEKITKIVREKEYPDPEKLYRGEEPVPPGKVVPIRVIQGQKEEDIKADPLHRRMTTEISVIVRYRVYDFMTFIGTIGTLEELDRTIEDLLIASLRRDLAVTSPAETLRGWGIVEKKLQKKVEDLVTYWGVEVQTTRMKEVDVGHKVNSALRDIIAADLNKKSTIVNAEAEKQKRTLEGAGLAEARKIFLEAEGIGYKKIADELGLKEGEIVLAAETVKTLTKESQYTLLTGSAGLSDIFGAVAAMKNVLEKIKTKEA